MLIKIIFFSLVDLNVQVPEEHSVSWFCYRKSTNKEKLKYVVYPFCGCWFESLEVQTRWFWGQSACRSNSSDWSGSRGTAQGWREGNNSPRKLRSEDNIVINEMFYIHVNSVNCEFLSKQIYEMKNYYTYRYIPVTIVPLSYRKLMRFASPCWFWNCCCEECPTNENLS